MLLILLLVFQRFSYVFNPICDSAGVAVAVVEFTVAYFYLRQFYCDQIETQATKWKQIKDWTKQTATVFYFSFIHSFQCQINQIDAFRCIEWFFFSCWNGKTFLSSICWQGVSLHIYCFALIKRNFILLWLEFELWEGYMSMQTHIIVNFSHSISIHIMSSAICDFAFDRKQ